MLGLLVQYGLPGHLNRMESPVLFLILKVAYIYFKKVKSLLFTCACLSDERKWDLRLS